MTDAETTQTTTPYEPLPLTVEEFFEQYGNQPAEVINGEVVLMSPNTRLPMQVAAILFADLFAFVQANDLGTVLFETAYVLDADERTNWVRSARQPDIAFVTRARVKEHNKRFGKGGPWRLAPDLAIEIVSPTDSQNDIESRVHDYLRFGVPLIFVFDPFHRDVRVHTQDNPDGTLLNDTDTLIGDPVLPGWSIALSGIFGAES